MKKFPMNRNNHNKKSFSFNARSKRLKVEGDFCSCRNFSLLLPSTKDFKFKFSFHSVFTLKELFFLSLCSTFRYFPMKRMRMSRDDDDDDGDEVRNIELPKGISRGGLKDDVDVRVLIRFQRNEAKKREMR
jgi:hypothetical protein